MRISDWSSDVCSSYLDRSSNSLLEVGALSQTMIETDFSRLIEPTRINSRLYTDPAIFAGEMEKIWYRTWVYVGHESEVPEKNDRSEEHTSELQSLMRISYAVFCLKKKRTNT